MKKKTGSIFFRVFIKSFFYLCIFVLMFFVSYLVTGFYLKQTKGDNSDNGKVNMDLQGTVDAVAFNLIFSLDEQNDELEHVVLETLNTNTNTLMYTTIPMNARMSMSSELYQSEYQKNKDIPQIISFSKLKDYLVTSNYYDFSATLFEDVLHEKISYCTVVPADIFDDIFADEEGCLVLSDTVKQATAGFEESDIIEYLSEFYKSVSCNLSLQERLTYTPALSKIYWEDVVYAVIPGEGDSTGFEIDTEKAGEVWSAVRGDGSAETLKGLTGTVEQVSIGKTIEVLNGTGINGLAGNVKSELENAGYTVVGINNYSSSDIEETIIQVKEDGLGNDLVSYFHSAAVEINEDMPYDVDIIIILGKSESVS